jgi:choline transport protein
MSTLGWLASVSSSVFVLTTQIEAIIDVTNPDFAFPRWQYTLIMLAFLLVTIFFNTWGARSLPMMETVSLVMHIGGFVVTIIVLWAMAPRNSASAVFTEVVNNGGWSNTGTACLVAQVSVLYCNLGSDSAVHICKSTPSQSVL